MVDSLASLLDRLGISYRHRVMLLLLLMLAVDYAERALIGALGPTLKHTFDINNTELGLLSAVSILVAAVTTVPFGMLTDRVSRVKLLAVSMALWCVAAVATGAAISFTMLIVARLFLGAVAAATGPTVPSLVGDLVPAGQRARALGHINSGQLIGSGLGIILAATITVALSFRWCFWLLAAAGAGVAFELSRAREPERTGAGGPEAPGDSGSHDRSDQPRTQVQRILSRRGVEPRPEAILRDDPKTMSMWDATRYVVRVRTDVVVLIARSIGDYFFAGVATFGIVFATDQYGVSERVADLAILLLGVGALVGFIGGGRIGDLLVARGRVKSRVWLGSVGYIAAPVTLLPAILTNSLTVALPLMTLGSCFLAATSPPLDAVRIDVIVPLLRGRAEAIRQVARSAAEASAPAVFGLIAQHLMLAGIHGLQLAFLLTLPTLVLTGIVLLVALRTYQGDVEAALASTNSTNGP